jgi:hypothetical protein
MFAAHASMLLLTIVEGLFIDAKFKINFHDRSAIFFFFKGFNDLTLGVSAFFHLTGEISGFCRILCSSNLRSTYRGLG